MSAGARYRGQPLMALLILLGGWSAMRIAMWEEPFTRARVALPGMARAMASGPPAAPVRAGLPIQHAGPRPGHQPASENGDRRGHAGLAPGSRRVAVPGAAGPVPAPFRQGAADRGGNSHAAGQPASLAPVPPQAIGQGGGGLLPARWAGDAWLLLRRDTTSAVTSGRGSYGQSQLGAVLRYRLAPADGHRPMAYLRASQALAGSRESEVAAGLSARPVPAIPLSVAGELRVLRTGGRAMLRPAAYAVTEIAPFALPAGITAEVYAQAGYVGGEFATGFVDGQIRAARHIARIGPAHLRAGGGLWGGAQRGASRMDIGPGAVLGMQAGKVPARLALDWRFRIAGRAEPSHGPTLTISAGF